MYMYIIGILISCMYGLTCKCTLHGVCGLCLVYNVACCACTCTCKFVWQHSVREEGYPWDIMEDVVHTAIL